MLFRFTIALLVLFNTLPSPSSAAGEGTAQGTAVGSEVTVVGPTEESAAFIAVRPVRAPEVPRMSTMEMVPEPAGEVPTRGMQQIGEMTEPRMMERLMERPDLTTAERETMRGIRTRMRTQPMQGTRGTRGRRLYRRAGTRAEAPATVETPHATTPVPTAETPTVPTTEQPAAEQPTAEQPTTEQPTTERPTTERPTMERPTMERPTMERPTMERPTMEEPMTTPETEQVTPAASVMSVRGARFNTAVGDMDISSEMFGARQGERTIPQTAVRDAEFNTFVGRLRAHSTELPRRMEPQWEGEWMPRGRFEWMPRRRFEWMPRGRFEWMPRRTRRFVGRFE